jgi:hypothetical protein
MKNARNIVVTAFVVIAAVIAVGVWKGVIPPKSGTEGAIGAAQRYTSPQITDSDVQLTDPSIQAFIQSDLFHAIATNPDFQKVIKQDAFKKTANVEGMLALSTQDYGHGVKNFDQLVASEDFQKINKSADFNKAIKDPKVQNLLGNSDFQKWLASADYQEYLADAAKGTAKDAHQSKNPEWLALTSNADMKEALKNADFIAAATSTDMAKIIKENQKWFANQDFMTLLANEDFRNLVVSEDYRNLVASPEYKNLTASTDFRQICANEDFQKIAKQDLAAAVAASEDMQKNKER